MVYMVIHDGSVYHMYVPRYVIEAEQVSPVDQSSYGLYP